MPDDSPKYLVRDQQGNVYGPADSQTLRSWVQQGRIVAGMFIAPRETREWIEVSAHPLLADFLHARLLDSPTSGQVTVAPAAPDPGVTYPVQPLPAQITRQSRQPAGYPTGAIDPVPISYAQPPRQNALGVLSFIFGLAGMIFSICGCFPLCGWFVVTPICGLLDLTAITLGSIALYQIKENPAQYSSRGFAITGLSIGITMLVLYAVGATLFFANFMAHP